MHPFAMKSARGKSRAQILQNVKEDELTLTNEYENKVLPEGEYIAEQAPAIGIAEQLGAIKQLKELLDLGAITQAEFEEKKAELLGLPKKKIDKKRFFLILLWASLGFTVFSYLINVIISLDVGGNLFWMFDYILYGYIAGFICMGVGIGGYIASFCFLSKNKEEGRARVISMILMVALLCVCFSPLVFHDPFSYTQYYDGSYGVIGCEYRRKNIEIPARHNGEDVKEIGTFAFSNRSKLLSVKIEDGVRVIGEGAFCYSANLESIVIPKSVQYIGANVFIGCDSLSIFCDAESQPKTWQDGWNCSFNDYSNPNREYWTYVKVYWAGEWKYDWQGNPVPIQ